MGSSQGWSDRTGLGIPPEKRRGLCTFLLQLERAAVFALQFKGGGVQLKDILSTGYSKVEGWSCKVCTENRSDSMLVVSEDLTIDSLI